MWIRDYLSNRTQRVIANNMISEDSPVISGVPQGSVLGPILFLILIDSIAGLDIGSSIGIFADDTRIVRQIWTELDASNLQSDLETLYEWADLNNMSFNGDKFECIKIGNNPDLKTNYNYLTPGHEGVINDVDHLRDLGVIVSDSCDYRDHIYKVVAKVKQRAGWVSRTFVRNSISFRRYLWRTYIQSLLDYGSQVWTPTKPSLLLHLESAQRMFTYHTEGLQEFNYWERLQRTPPASCVSCTVEYGEVLLPLHRDHALPRRALTIPKTRRMQDEEGKL